MTGIDERMAGLDAARRRLLQRKLRDAQAAKLAAERIPVADRGQSLPLSYAQQRLWFLDQFTPGVATYKSPLALRLHSRIDVARLRLAMTRMVARHEILRTRYLSEDGLPYQVIDPPPDPLPVLVVDATEDEMRAAVLARSREPIDLAAGPAVRAFLWRLAEDDYVAMLDMHHISTDGWSTGLLTRELMALYWGADPAPLPIQYGDYAAWQRATVTGSGLKDQLQYWKTTLADLPALDFASDRPRPTNRTWAGTFLPGRLPVLVRAGIEALARANGVTSMTVLLAGFTALLHRYTGQDDIVIGSIFSGRTRAELEPLVGFFANTLVLRTRIPATFAELITATDIALKNAHANQDVPFDKVVDALQPVRDPNRNPLFDVCLAYQDATTTLAKSAVVPATDGSTTGGSTTDGTADGSSDGGYLEVVPISLGTSRFDLVAYMGPAGDGTFVVGIEYSTELFDPARVMRFAAHYEQLLTAAIADPDVALSAIALLDDAERELVVHTWNQTAMAHDTTEMCVHDLVSARAAQAPGSIAVRFGTEDVTYRELDERANDLAWRLRDRGVGAESRVGVLLDRSPELPIALLGILKAGAAYVPLDTTHPESRQGLLLQDANCKLVVTSEGGQVPADTAAVPALVGRRAEPPPGCVTPDNLAYVIYTSGSTGRPKGVLVSHRAVVNYVSSVGQVFGLAPQDRVLQFSNPTFDVSVFDVFGALSAGATLVMGPRESMVDPVALAELMRAERVSVAAIAPAMLAVLEPDGYPSLRAISAAGEAYPAEVANRWRTPGRSFHNSYGPTEATVVCVDYLCPQDRDLEYAPPIGRAMPNHRAYVLDRHGVPAPIGIAGRLFIAGPGVARGYLDRPALSAERFGPDPFGPAGSRMYDTGDLAQWTADGQLRFLGRTDDQVKVRGFRVEPGEIAAALMTHPSVTTAVVIASGEGVDRRLLAYLVPAAGAAVPPVEQLRQHLAGLLPPYMIPAAFVVLDQLPLTSSGKIDRAALPAPDARRPDLAVEYVAPATPREREIAAVWSEILGVERIGATDNFFALGGNSLQATQLVSRIRRACRLALDLRTLFANPTIGQLATLDLGEVAPTGAGIPRADRAGRLPLSYAQQRLWFLDQFAPGRSIYKYPFALRMTGAVDVDTLHLALTGLVARHEILRTRYLTEDGVPYQVVDPPAAAAYEVIDLRGWPDLAKAEEEMRAIMAARAQRPVDLAADPALRATVVRLADEDTALLVDLHHIGTDGWSTAVLVRELVALYQGNALPELPIQYADFAAWQRDQVSGDDLSRQLAHWTDRLADLPSLDFPADRPRPANRTWTGHTLSFSLPAPLRAGVEALAMAIGVTPVTVWLAGIYALLWRYTGQDDLILGSVFSGRTRPELEPLIGFFVNTLVLRLDATGARSLRDLVRRTNDVLLDAHDHQDVPFDKIVDALRPVRDPNRNPLFDICLAYQDVAGANPGGGGTTAQAGKFAAQGLPLRLGTSRFDLVMYLGPAADGTLAMNLEFSSELFDADRISRLAADLERLLTAGVAAPDSDLDEIELLPEAERERVLVEWNNTGVAFESAGACVHELIGGVAATAPDRVAVRFGDDELSYRELDERANDLAWRLRAAGVGPETIVGVLMERGPELPVALLGILKAGGAYLPLDTTYPASRLALLVEDAGCRIVVSHGDGHGAAALAHMTVVPVGRDCAAAAPPPAAGSENIAYVIYTSGSTGRPKGVLVPHRAVVNYVSGIARRFRLQPADRVLQFSNPTFDVSVFDIFGALAAGATVVMGPRESMVDPAALARLLRDERVTVAAIAPAMLAVLDPGGYSCLRLVSAAGEAFAAEVANRWRAPGREFHNSYGPTEATVHCIDYLCPSDMLSQPPPIGRALPNARAFVLDRRERLAPIGVAGRLFIGGAGVARGYLGRPALTAQRFRPDPFGPAGSRMYDTGDLAQWTGDGQLLFLGRTDDQVKVRGFRVEPGEIAAALMTHPAVATAVVTASGDGVERRLIAYVVPATGRAVPPVEQLRQYLGGLLPPYMMPAAFLALDRIPLTSSGKLDRGALPATDSHRPDLASAYVEPDTQLEREIAAVWAEVLGLDRIGAADDFFALGGDSIRSIQAVARLRARLDRPVEVRDMFRAPTVAGLAALLSGSFVRAIGPLVPIKPTGHRTPWFLVHPSGGSVLPYAALSRYVDADQPIYGLESIGLDGQAEPVGSVVEMARSYIEAIRSVQPAGPYLLGGWSLGGGVAYEMAHLLQADGAEVAMVAMLDTAVPTELATRPDQADLLPIFLQDMAGLSGLEPSSVILDSAQLRARSPHEQIETVIERLSGTGLDREQLGHRLKVFLANLTAGAIWRPTPIAVPALLLVTGGADATGARARGWARFGPIEAQPVAGNHYSMLAPPHVEALASLLSQRFTVTISIP